MLLDNKTKLVKYIGYLIIILILTDVFLLLYITFYTVPNNIYNIIIDFDLTVCLILFTEFIIRFHNATNKKEFIKHNWLDLIACIPLDFFLLRCLRFIRLFRLIRVARVFLLFRKNIKVFTHFIKTTNLDKLLIIIVLIIISSTLALFLLDPNTPTFFSSFWYVIVTLTTVGYGDITPSTRTGKIIGVFLILVGILMVSILTGAISSIYTSKIEAESDDIILKEISELRKEVQELKETIEKQK
jgi:voltage-gated potassium channel